MFLRQIWRGFRSMNSLIDSKRIGTHNGVFHCDEVLACFMLKQLPEYKNAEIVRTRDPALLDTTDIVVDVGGVYEPAENRFDHHQRSFEHTLSTVRPDISKKRCIKLSSAGLIYAHFGSDVLREILTENNVTFTPEELLQIYLAVYDGFIEEIDAIDNGIPMYAEGTPRYHIDTHLSARVHMLNPEWNNTEEPDMDALFQEAMEIVGNEFTKKVLKVATVWLPARKLVRKAIQNRKEVHESGQIVELQECCPWKYHLLDIEEELNIKNEIKFVIYHENLNDSWRVQGVPIQPDSFICRKFLHKDWQGVRDEELSTVSGIPNCIFCHATGFIGGNKTREGALKMALLSLEA